ncbi:MAG: hypothetical protein JWQ03_2121 [Variovorax sp.]|nr:hypothetical protein [Variovorax sp.]
MTLQYLVFDHSEDTEGGGVFDAMASTGPQQAPAVLAEVAQVLDWAHATFPGQRAPIEEGGEWDFDLQAVQEVATPQRIDYDVDRRAFDVRPGTPGLTRHTVTLSIGGTGAFCEAFRSRFAAALP